MSRLRDALRELKNWERFASHLPGIDQNDIKEISSESTGLDQQKLALFKRWLDKCGPSHLQASWEHVIDALGHIYSTNANNIAMEIMEKIDRGEC